jgi:putative transposase
MPRTRRVLLPCHVQHVMNRGNARQRVFQDRYEYEAFIELLAEAGDHSRVPLLAFSLMPNHWHLVLWPTSPKSLSAYMHWLTTTHVLRLHRRRGTKGQGHIYQERYRNVTVTSEHQFFALCRYVERNALASGLVKRAEDWPYCSLARTKTPSGRELLSPWPVPRPPGWLASVSDNQSCATCPETEHRPLYGDSPPHINWPTV